MKEMTPEKPTEHQHGSETPMKEMTPEKSMGHQHGSLSAADPYDIHTCPMPTSPCVLNYGPGELSGVRNGIRSGGGDRYRRHFVCPMPQCGVAQPDSGVCPVCGMNLIKYQPGESHDQ